MDKATADQFTSEDIKAAREWLLDCFPYETDEIAQADDYRIICAVSQHWEGGLAGFLRTCRD